MVRKSSAYSSVLGALLASLCLWGFAASPALADKDKAKEHFRKGMVAYDLERWDDAIAKFSAGYIEFNDPVFLYNIAQSNRLAGRPKQAIDYYRKYLARSPDAPNRAEVERQLAELKESIALDVLPPESKSTAKKPTVTTKPAETKPSVAEKPVEAKPVESKPAIAEKPTESKPAVAEKPTESKPAVAEKPTESKPAVAEKPTESKPAVAEKPVIATKPVVIAEPADEVPAAALVAEPAAPQEQPPVWKRWPLWVGVAGGVVVVGGAAATAGVLATRDHTLLLMTESAR